MSHIAVFFDDRVRADTTGVHCRWAIERVADCIHLRPEDPEATKLRADLYLQIDDGISPAISRELSPSALWAIDTHLDYERLLKMARSFDWVFCAQREAVRVFRNDSIKNVSWLPLAADPDVHRPIDAGQECYDVCFVGNVVTRDRAVVLKTLSSAFPKNFIGNAYDQDYRRIVAQSKIIFNRSVRSDLNMRVFEALAMGKPLVTDRLPYRSGLSRLFRESIDFCAYTERGAYTQLGEYRITEENFTTIVRALLEKPERRRALAAAGRSTVLRSHTYLHRVRSILRRFGLRCEMRTMRRRTSISRRIVREHFSDPPVVSIIIPVLDGIRYTKQCLRSLYSSGDDIPYEVVAIDNGSSDGTQRFLSHWTRGKRSGSLKDFKLILNQVNLGFVRAINQGLKRARGEYIVLLNNDTIVPKRWLTRLTEVAKKKREYGLVGPVSNYSRAEQLIDGLPYSVEEFESRAEEIEAVASGESQEVRRLSGFCLLIKREVVDIIGGLDERFGIGMFDDDDYCVRAEQAGYKCVVAKGVFVHHFGSKTFERLKIDCGDLLRENYQKFTQKWSLGKKGVSEFRRSVEHQQQDLELRVLSILGVEPVSEDGEIR